MIDHRFGTFGLLCGSVFIAGLLLELIFRLAGIRAFNLIFLTDHVTLDQTAHLTCYDTNPHGELPIDLWDEQQRRQLRQQYRFSHLNDPRPINRYCVLLRYDSKGFRLPPKYPAFRDPFRILALGDSFTMGAGVTDEATWPEQLRLNLMQKDSTRCVEVFNAGKSDYGIYGIDANFQGSNAELTIYAYVLNDPVIKNPALAHGQDYINDLIMRRVWKVDHASGSSLFDFFRTQLVLARVRRKTIQWYRDIHSQQNAAGWHETEQRLRSLQQKATAHGGSFWVVIYPLLIDLDRDYPFVELHQFITTSCQKLGIRVLDLLPAFSGQNPTSLWVHPVDLHPNRTAQAIAAAAIADQIVNGPAAVGR